MIWSEEKKMSSAQGAPQLSTVSSPIWSLYSKSASTWSGAGHTKDIPSLGAGVV